MRFRITIFLIILVFISFQPTKARIIHIPTDSSTIQGGIDGAANGDTVSVAPGIYYEHISFSGKAILVRSEAGADSTIISKLYDGLPIVIFNSQEDSTSILDGFTVQNANNDVGYGGAIYASSSPIIRNNIIKENSAYDGGGICCIDCAPIISQNRFINNSGSFGGAIYCSYSSPIISQNFFLRNVAYDGGAIECQSNCTATISQNLMIKNITFSAGGAVFCRDSSPMIANNTLYGNSSGNMGSVGLIGSSPYITNTIISNESSMYGICAIENSAPTITYCDIWNNAIGDFYGCIPGPGCISSDPFFCDIASVNYYLFGFSPCLGTGQGGTNIGAYGQGCFIIGDANEDGSINIADVVYVLNYVIKGGPDPNPLQAGDVTCDGNVDVGDIIYFVNYLFKGGPAPSC
jgi:predicted outer membrane repeat protein